MFVCVLYVYVHFLCVRDWANAPSVYLACTLRCVLSVVRSLSLKYNGYSQQIKFSVIVCRNDLTKQSYRENGRSVTIATGICEDTTWYRMSASDNDIVSDNVETLLNGVIISHNIVHWRLQNVQNFLWNHPDR